MSEKSRKSLFGKMSNFLPPSIKNELTSLERDRDDDSVSSEIWHARADILINKGLSLPGPIRDRFIRTMRTMADEEREIEQNTGKLVGLPVDADQIAILADEEKIREQIRSGVISVNNIIEK